MMTDQKRAVAVASRFPSGRFRRLFPMAVVTVLAGFASGAGAAGERSSHPNVLFIMTDQQSGNMMSCTGNKWLRTPAMDRIAAMGYRFENNYCANPVCMPSRFSLFTGHHASEVGMKKNTLTCDQAAVRQVVAASAWGNVFRKAGYETLYSGKTHLYGTTDLSEYGFKLNDHDPYDGPALYAERVLPQLARSDRPFLLVLSFMNPHDICFNAGAYPRFAKLDRASARETLRLLAVQKRLSAEEYRRQVPPRPANTAPTPGAPVAPANRRISSWDEAQWDLFNWMYHRLTESVDAQIGRVLAALDKSGLADNTLIIFTSDHGEMNGSHGLVHKEYPYGECQKVPFIFAGKGIPRGYADKTTLTCNGLDLLPTVCDLAGVEPPKGLAGISLKPYLTGSGHKPERKYIFTEIRDAYQANDGHYKYTVYEQAGHPELLTDLKANPGETVNYAADPAYAEIKATMQKALAADLAKRLVFRTVQQDGEWRREPIDVGGRGLDALPQDGSGKKSNAPKNAKAGTDRKAILPGELPVK